MQLQVDRDYDTITASPVANIIFLTDSDAQITKLFEIDIIQEFSYEGSPFKGPEDAPVTLAVFSDFQWPYCAQLNGLLEQVLKQ